LFALTICFTFLRIRRSRTEWKICAGNSTIFFSSLNSQTNGRDKRYTLPSFSCSSPRYRRGELAHHVGTVAKARGFIRARPADLVGELPQRL